MPKHASAWFVKNEVPKLFIIRDESGLFPYRIAWRRRHTPYDDIANLTCRMATDNVNDL